MNHAPPPERTHAAPARDLRALVVDDHRIFAEALAVRLADDARFVQVKAAFSAEQALVLAHTHRPHVVLLDVGLEDGRATGLVDDLLEARSDLVVVMMSGMSNTADVITALSHGARAWIPKDTTFSELVHAIDEAMTGRVWLPADLVSPVLASLLAKPVVEQVPRSFIDDLTPRQQQILECLANGMSRAEIARHLVLSPHTVRTHVQDVLRKADVHSTLAALAKAREAGYLDRAATHPARHA